jgi:DNA-binding Lrp family transcriptional regulator
VRLVARDLYSEMAMDVMVFRMVEALILVRVGSSETLNFMKTVKEQLCKIDCVKDVYGVFGRYDFVVRLETKSLEELGNVVTDCIRGIKGVLTTETLVMGF